MGLIPRNIPSEEGVIVVILFFTPAVPWALLEPVKERGEGISSDANHVQISICSFYVLP